MLKLLAVMAALGMVAAPAAQAQDRSPVVRYLEAPLGDPGAHPLTAQIWAARVDVAGVCRMPDDTVRARFVLWSLRNGSPSALPAPTWFMKDAQGTYQRIPNVGAVRVFWIDVQPGQAYDVLADVPTMPLLGYDINARSEITMPTEPGACPSSFD
jgi:hypothetical protein